LNLVMFQQDVAGTGIFTKYSICLAQYIYSTISDIA